MFGSDISARVEAMRTIAPRALRSDRSAARANRNAAVRLVSMTRCHSSSVSRRSGLRIMMPALETTASSRPNLSTSSFTARGNGLFVADIAFDQNDVAIARRKSTLQPAARPVDDADAPPGRRADDARWRGRCRWRRRSPARRVSLSPCRCVRRAIRARRECRAASPIPSTSRRRGPWRWCRSIPARMSGSRPSCRSRTR